MNDGDLEAAIERGDAVHFETVAQLNRLAIAMAQRSRRYLDLIIGTPDIAAYDTVDFVAAVKQLVVGNPHSRVRVLLLDAGAVLGEGHRLIELAMRLSSYMEIRGLAPEFHGGAEAALIADQRHAVHIPRSRYCVGQAWFDAPRRARQLTEGFEELWRCGEADPNFRRLLL